LRNCEIVSIVKLNGALLSITKQFLLLFIT